MEILFCSNTETIEKMNGYTWNTLWKCKESYQYILSFDLTQVMYSNGAYIVKENEKPHTIYPKEYRPGCRHILLSDSALDQKWAYPNLKNWIHPTDRVCILALTFFDDTKNVSDWNRQYKEGQGFLYRMNQDIFYRYGIPKENIEWIQYFSDTKEEMAEKIMNSTILYIPGGAPDWFMKRVKECRLKKVIQNYQGTMIGVSAGAMVPFVQFHITPDDEYPTFQYVSGLSMLRGFDVEVHYQGNNHQKEYIQKVIKEKNIDVYGIGEQGGLMIQNQNINMFGKVEVFNHE